MTNPPDPQLADSIGNELFFVILIAFNVWTRFKQGKHLETSIDNSLHHRVAQIESSLKTTQDLLATNTERVRESILESESLRGEMTEHRKEMHAVTQVIEDGRDTVNQINDFLQRAKAGTLVEKPIAGSGGLTAIKEKEKKS